MKQLCKANIFHRLQSLLEAFPFLAHNVISIDKYVRKLCNKLIIRNTVDIERVYCYLFIAKFELLNL